MLKICHIISGDLWAGAEVMAYHLIKGLTRYNGLDILVVVLNEGKLVHKLRNIGIEVELIDENSTLFLNTIRSLRRLLEEFRPHIIHTHRYKESILAHWSINGLKKPGLIATQHGMPENYKRISSLKHLLVLKYNFYVLKRHFERVVAVSNDIGNYFLRDLGFWGKKVLVIHNGIKIPDHAIRRNSGHAFVIGSCGRLFPVKDYPLMIKVAKECTSDKNNIRFELAGDGPEMRKLRVLVERFGLNGRFTFRGHLDNMEEFYRGLDLFINTSIHEGIPMSVLEAMSYGLPIVAPRVGGLREIIDHGVDGFLIESRYAKAFAEKCLLLAKDERLWQKMSKAARQKVINHFSVNHMAEEYYNLYLEVLDNG